uniref:Uncharacterized protein n=1 Tax=Arundo donax TaxID=35708 RepID=A0A0A8ZBK1_ARUDO
MRLSGSEVKLMVLAN